MLDLLISLLIMVIVFAVIMYAINTFLPLDPALKNIVVLIIGAVFLVWILSMFLGYATPFPGHWRSRP